MSLSQTDADLFLNFIRVILPIDNNIPDTFYKLKKNVNNRSEINVIKQCSYCDSVLDKVFSL